MKRDNTRGNVILSGGLVLQEKKVVRIYDPDGHIIEVGTPSWMWNSEKEDEIKGV